ncbi:MAG: SLBB domain-containing protein [Candidatus Omnitrophota bacterium]
MFKKLINFNVLLCGVFLLTMVFPGPLFSEEVKGNKRSWQNEALEITDPTQKAETYKGVRCPRCNMEFYYILGGETPHSHWVNYEVPQEEGLKDVDASPDVKDKKNIGTGKNNLLNIFGADNNPASDRPRDKDISFSEEASFESKEYKIRQKLRCPYDGYDFFPEGDVLESGKLLRGSLSGEPSSVEESFLKSIPFGASRDLEQFGYNLFYRPERLVEDEGVSADKEKVDAFSALGMLKAVISGSGSATSSVFSSQSDIGGQQSVVPIGPDYIIGPGDTLVVNIWGSVQNSFPVTVDREGKIMLPKSGPLYLWGLRFEEAENRIKERLNQFYTNFNVDVSMGKIRDIQIFVMGEVKKPGSYSINSQSTVFQALYEAGGPIKTGSLRKIKLMHGDGKEEVVDLYPFLLEGKDVGYAKIQSGDTVFVPTIGDTVAISGNVKRPAIYEVKDEITLSDLLAFSGGVTPTGDLQRLQIERVENNEIRTMFDVETKKTDDIPLLIKNTRLQNGDMAIISPIVRLKHNFVSILGNVERPGDYALTKDMKVSDLIKRAKGFMPATHLYRAEVARVTKDKNRQIMPINLEAMELGKREEDIFLKEWDILLIYSEAQIQPPLFVKIEGAINDPGEYIFTPEMKISDLIFKGGGVKQDEVIRGAELFHIMPGGQPVIRDIAIRYLSKGNISIDKDIFLRAGDVLFVKSEPRLTKRRVVTIEGEVRYPGNYSVRKGERMSFLIERAGGFTEEAFLEGAFFTRASIKELQEKMKDKFLEKENKSLLEEQQAILLRGSNTGIVASSATSSSLDTRRQMLDFITSVEITGRMVITLLPVSKLKNSKYDILLEDGDTLEIPQIPSAVSVMGSVINPTSIPFESGKGMEYYIKRTGGLTRHADKAGVYVLRANGEAVSKFMMSKAVGRGDTIVIPQRFVYARPAYDIFKDMVDMLSRIAIGVAIISALD